jgi:hypothetical protein
MLDGEFTSAGDDYDAMGFAVFAAAARERAARALIASGMRADGEQELEKALAFYRAVDARLFIRRADELLAATA